LVPRRRRVSRPNARRSALKDRLGYAWILPAILLLFLLPYLLPGDAPESLSQEAWVEGYSDFEGMSGVDVGGSLRISVSGLIETLDPHQAMTQGEQAIAAAITDGLFEYRAEEGITGAAASDWSFSDDGRVLEIHMRPGISFADGTPCDAEAVAENLRRVREVGPPVVAGAWLASVREIEVVDPDTLKIHLWYADPNLLFTLARPQMGLVSPSAVAKREEAFEMEPVGLGPFSVDWQVGIEGAGDRSFYAGEYMGGEGGLGDPLAEEVSVGLTPTEDYYRGDPRLGSVTFVTSASGVDPETLKDLDFGLMMRVPFGYSAPEGYRAVRRPQLDQHVLMYNLASPVLEDERARRAIDAAIDRAHIIEEFFRHDAQLLGPGEIPLTGEKSEEESMSPDLEQGRSLLDDAGFLAPEAGSSAEAEPAHVLNMITDSEKSRVEVSRMLAEQIERLGIGVDLEVLERSEYYERMRAGEFDLSYWVLMPEVVDPLAYTANMRSDSYWNVSQMWHNPDLRSLQNQIDDILMEAASQYDPDARREKVAEFGRLVEEHYLYASLWTTSVRGLVREDVQELRIPYGHDLRLHHAWIRSD